MEGCFEAWNELIAYHDLLFCMLEKGSLLILKLLEPGLKLLYEIKNLMRGKSFNSFFFIQPCMTNQKPRGLHFFISGYATVVELPTSGLH